MRGEDSDAAVARILSSKCYYAILGLTKTCSQARIRQAYRHLALTYHPDKNKCEGAVEAFQAISTAYEVLSDKGRRVQYDRRVEEEERMAQYDYSYEYYYREHECEEEQEDESVAGHYGRRQFYYRRRYGR